MSILRKSPRRATYEVLKTVLNLSKLNTSIALLDGGKDVADELQGGSFNERLSSAIEQLERHKLMVPYLTSLAEDVPGQRDELQALIHLWEAYEEDPPIPPRRAFAVVTAVVFGGLVITGGIGAWVMGGWPGAATVAPPVAVPPEAQFTLSLLDDPLPAGLKLTRVGDDSREYPREVDGTFLVPAGEYTLGFTCGGATEPRRVEVRVTEDRTVGGCLVAVRATGNGASGLQLVRTGRDAPPVAADASGGWQVPPGRYTAHYTCPTAAAATSKEIVVTADTTLGELCPVAGVSNKPPSSRVTLTLVGNVPRFLRLVDARGRPVERTSEGPISVTPGSYTLQYWGGDLDTTTPEELALTLRSNVRVRCDIRGRCKVEE